MNQNITIVPELSMAKFWLSREKNNHVSLNKLYQLHPDNNNGCIKDDNGTYGEWHLIFKGDYVVLNTTTKENEVVN
jgi:hypothetical protein